MVRRMQSVSLSGRRSSCNACCCASWRKAQGVKLPWRRTQPDAVVSNAVVNLIFGGAPHGATKRVRVGPKWVGETHVDPATGAAGGALYGATN
eukprot:3929683-Pyramimonas_sp.AAC.1